MYLGVKGLMMPTKRLTPADFVIEESEFGFQNSVVDLARRCKWFVFHDGDSRRSTGKGFPDLVMVRNGLLVFAELKRESEALSKNKNKWGESQETWRAALEEVECEVQSLSDNFHYENMTTGPPNVRYFVWRPSQWDEIVSVLNDGGQ